MREDWGWGVELFEKKALCFFFLGWLFIFLKEKGVYTFSVIYSFNMYLNNMT